MKNLSDARYRDALRRTRRGPLPKQQRQGAAMVASAVLAPLAGASPVGTRPLDLAWSIGLSLLAAYLASTAKRGPLLVAAIVATLCSRTLFGVLLALAAVVFAALSTLHLRRRAIFARAMAGGAMAVSLLSSGSELPAWLTPIAILGVGGPIVVSGLRNAPSRVRRTTVGWGAVAIFVALGASAFAAIGAATSAGKVDEGTTELRIGLAAARQGDVATAATHLKRASDLLEDARSGLDRLGFAGRVIPITGQHVSALSAVLSDVGRAADEAALTAVAADTSQLTVQQGRIDPSAVQDLANPLRRLAASLGDAVDEAHRRADDPLVPPVKDRLEALEREAAKAQREAGDGAAAAETLPQLLGADGPRRYLVLFTSPAEARGRFGFPGAFAEVTFDDGRMTLQDHGATSEVFRSNSADQSRFAGDSDQLAPYASYGSTQTLLSVTIPPDFPSVAENAAELWAQSGRQPVDGVFRFDPRSLAPLLQFTGPVLTDDVPEPLTAANLEQFLLLGQYLQFPQSNAPRRELLETVSEVTFSRLQTADLPQARTLIQTFGPLVDEGHIEFVAFDRDSRRLLRRIGLDGAFEPPPDDGLLVANVNVTGNKIDAFLTRAVRYQATVDEGDLLGRLTVELTNAAPAAGLPQYVIGAALKPTPPQGTNVTSLLIYTAVPATELKIDGVVTAFRSDQTGGRWLHQVTVTLPPESTRTVELELSGPLPSTDYQLALDPGVGTAADQYDVDVRLPDGRHITYGGPVATRTTLR